MGELKTAGIVIGVIVVSVIGIAIVMPALSNIGDYSDARFAKLETYYDERDGRLTVVMLLSNSDGNYVKANGDTEITICKVDHYSNSLTNCFTSEHKFEKNGFYTWTNNFGAKFTGYQFNIDRHFSSGPWDVNMDINAKNGLTWVDVDSDFYSLG